MKKAAIIYSRKFSRIRTFAIGIVIVLIVLESALINAPKFAPIVKANIASATSSSSEKFTELYFNDHAQLPDIIYDQDKYKFSFTIRNQEAKKTTYKYSVYLKRGDLEIVLHAGEATLEKGEASTISEEFGPLKNQKVEIIVELLGRNQKISFWMRPEEIK